MQFNLTSFSSVFIKVLILLGLQSCALGIFIPNIASPKPSFFYDEYQKDISINSVGYVFQWKDTKAYDYTIFKSPLCSSSSTIPVTENIRYSVYKVRDYLWNPWRGRDYKLCFLKSNNKKYPNIEMSCENIDEMNIFLNAYAKAKSLLAQRKPVYIYTYKKSKRIKASERENYYMGKFNIESFHNIKNIRDMLGNEYDRSPFKFADDLYVSSKKLTSKDVSSERKSKTTGN